MPSEPIYLDCAATTPIDPRVQAAVVRYMAEEFGNAGSRTHDFGARARRAVEQARAQVAAALGAGRGDVIFTSGATEADNLAILGLADHGIETNRRHIVSTQIEHNAVLEPLAAMARKGFELTLVPPTPGGWVDPRAIRAAVRDDTLLVSVMQINNETGIIQPIAEIADLLADHPAYFHVDAAQGVGLLATDLHNSRIDLLSISGHKFHAPKGIGALVARKRTGRRPPLAPLMFGGGQERGLRPGTLPVHLIVGLGLAAELTVAETRERTEKCRAFRQSMIDALAPLGPECNGDPNRCAPHILNLTFPGIDAESAIEALRDIVAISHGAACCSASFLCSHVLRAMGIDDARRDGAVRFSWSHETQRPDWPKAVAAIRSRQPRN